MRSKLFIGLCLCVPLLTSAQTAEHILENYFKSIGGIEAVRNFKSSSSRSLIIPCFGKKDTTLVVAMTKAPVSFHRSTYSQGQLNSETYGNAKGVTKLSYKPYFFDQFEKTNRKVYISTAHELLLAYDKRKVKRLADTSINNHDVYAIKTRLSKKDFPVNRSYFFDKTSGCLIASSSETIKNDLILFENYKPQGDLLIPMKTSHTSNGKTLMESHLQSLVINPVFHDSLFIAKKHKIASKPAFRLSKRVEYLDRKLADVDLTALTESFRGKFVLIDLWASWCGPCKSEFSQYNDVFHHYLKSKNIEMVYVNFDKDDKNENWKKLIDQFSLNGYHIRAERKLKQSIQQNIFDGEQMYIPRLILIGKNGEILSAQIPNFSSGFFYTKVDELINTVTP